MARKRRLAVLFTYLMLEVGLLLGAPIRPDEIDTITRLFNETQVTGVAERDAGGDPPVPVPTRHAARQRQRDARRR